MGLTEQAKMASARLTTLMQDHTPATSPRVATWGDRYIQEDWCAYYGTEALILGAQQCPSTRIRRRPRGHCLCSRAMAWTSALDGPMGVSGPGLRAPAANLRNGSGFHRSGSAGGPALLCRLVRAQRSQILKTESSCVASGERTPGRALPAVSARSAGRSAAAPADNTRRDCP